MDQFRALYERYYTDVYRFALFLTGDAARAEDLTADTFVRAWTARDRIRQNTVRAYLLTIARNLFRDGLRASRHQVPLDERLEDTGQSVDVRVERASALRQVRARLRQVARGDRRALLLYVIRDMSYAEIAHHVVRVLGGSDRLDRRHRRRHDVLDGQLGEIFGPGDAASHDVAVRDDADDLAALFHQERADLIVLHALGRALHGRRGPDADRFGIHELTDCGHCLLLLRDANTSALVHVIRRTGRSPRRVPPVRRQTRSVKNSTCPPRPSRPARRL